ncbi:hypothetical protein SAY87_015676 [Trapa incisa]|uniref:Uncharacterized protein n=1 Tax=Trapa incisa TaxID=236973 RepID=A0AAN7QXD9_9MYRT|nr:hypothetical protein SAY87_015676 [Trapa incisa]
MLCNSRMGFHRLVLICCNQRTPTRGIVDFPRDLVDLNLSKFSPLALARVDAFSFFSFLSQPSCPARDRYQGRNMRVRPWSVISCHVLCTFSAHGLLFQVLGFYTHYTFLWVLLLVHSPLPTCSITFTCNTTSHSYINR